MQTPSCFRLPQGSHPRSARGLHTATAFSLAFVLLAGLACDEKAPTETRAPSEVSASAGEVDGLAQRDASTMAIPLPVNQSIATTGTNPAFRINQTGSGPDGIFQISNSTSSQVALLGQTSGRGIAVRGWATGSMARAGLFEITNATNGNPALTGQTSGSGAAVQARATGSGPAGRFEILNSNSGNAAFFAQTAGTGPAGLFRLTKSSNNSDAISVLQDGLGGLASFQINNINNNSVGLNVESNGTGFGARVNARNGVQITSNSPNPSGIALTVCCGRSEFVGPEFQVGGSTVNPTNSVFNGDVTVNGTLTKTAGSFRIDHPLDPEHKYLSHSFVESPDMMNVYNGNVTLDANGRATVALPEYFEALNRDFRYQLTAIGAPGPNLYIAEGVKQNRFQIAGGRAYAHVSWQVTGVRQDVYAEQHRIRVEEEKPRGERALVAHR